LNPVPATCRRKDLAVESLKPQQDGCDWIIDWCDRAQPQDHSGEGFGWYCLHTNILDILSLFVDVPLSKRSTYIVSLQIYFSCVGKFVPGCYALTVTGELSEEMQVCLLQLLRNG
jgi:hypothetical protein